MQILEENIKKQTSKLRQVIDDRLRDRVNQVKNVGRFNLLFVLLQWPILSGTRRRKLLRRVDGEKETPDQQHQLFPSPTFIIILKAIYARST